MSEAVKIGTKVKITKVTNPKLLTIEGTSAEVYATAGAQFFAKTESGTEFAFDLEGRLGVEVVVYTRKDDANLVRARLEEAERQFNELKASMEADIDRLENYESNVAYETARFKTAVLNIVKEAKAE